MKVTVGIKGFIFEPVLLKVQNKEAVILFRKPDRKFKIYGKRKIKTG